MVDSESAQTRSISGTLMRPDNIKPFTLVIKNNSGNNCLYTLF
ncbi:hypothetical protein [Methanosarcina horonobensis]|nr:hypothetical protein [Methanosarcina horonobensis]